MLAANALPMIQSNSSAMNGSGRSRYRTTSVKPTPAAAPARIARRQTTQSVGVLFRRNRVQAQDAQPQNAGDGAEPANCPGKLAERWLEAPRIKLHGGQLRLPLASVAPFRPALSPRSVEHRDKLRSSERLRASSASSLCWAAP